MRAAQERVATSVRQVQQDLLREQRQHIDDLMKENAALHNQLQQLGPSDTPDNTAAPSQPTAVCTYVAFRSATGLHVVEYNPARDMVMVTFVKDDGSNDTRRR